MAYDEKTEAYAVIADEKIDVCTVSDTRRAALVNWIVVNCGIPLFNWTTDEEIEQIWKERCGNAFVGNVEISRALPDA